MKKGISKVLSVMCSVAALFGMLSINSAGAVRLTEQEVSTGFSIIYSYHCDPSDSISGDGIHINTEKFIAKIIYKLENLFIECSDKNLQDLRPIIINGIMRYMGDVDMADQRLYHLNILAGALQMISGNISFNDSEHSKDARRQFIRFKFAIQYMIEIVKNLSQESNITADDRKECVKAINLIIEKMNLHSMKDLDVRYIQNISNIVQLWYTPGVLSSRPL